MYMSTFPWTQDGSGSLYLKRNSMTSCRLFRTLNLSLLKFRSRHKRIVQYIGLIWNQRSRYLHLIIWMKWSCSNPFIFIYVSGIQIHSTSSMGVCTTSLKYKRFLYYSQWYSNSPNVSVFWVPQCFNSLPQTPTPSTNSDYSGNEGDPTLT